MDEQFLHFVWKYQKFKKHSLKTTDGIEIKILFQGNHNHDSGPDFENARILIDDLEWNGSVEIHLQSSNWYDHKHEQDKAYENVILHVVWNDNKPLVIKEERIPTLQLKNIVDPIFYEEYQRLMSQQQEILCHSHLDKIPRIQFINTLDRVLIERLREKVNSIEELLHQSNNDWEQVTYQLLASSFGFSTNKECFIQLAHSLPYSVLAKHKHNLVSCEALIFGQAGFLEESLDEYQKKLQTEYSFLSKKYKLKNILHRHHWKFSKMRPSNQPPIRLAQFAALISNHKSAFSKLLGTENEKELLSFFDFEVSEYWQSHIDFGKPSKNDSNRKLGNSTKENLIINTLSPLLFAYSHHVGNPIYQDRAIRLLEMLPAENNRITRKWLGVNKKPMSAFDSQSMIQLFNSYCSKKKCLDCSIGSAILAK